MIHRTAHFLLRALVLWVLLGATGALAQLVRFAAPEYPPYTSEVEGRATGLGVQLVEDIMQRAGLQMEVHIVPNYSRCVFEVSHQIADGFFLGSRNAERDAVAVLSQPVLINRWVWVRLRSDGATTRAPRRQQDAVGVLLNTNPHIWLRDNGYRITGTPTSSASLVGMLEAGRFDVALVPELVFQHAVQARGRSLSDYQVETHSDQAFGIYLSKDFLRRYPDSLERINRAIASLPPARRPTPNGKP